ncbi:MAG: heavy metal translocating P-type ATPase [Bryobacteraceae bacterium]
MNQDRDRQLLSLLDQRIRSPIRFPPITTAITSIATLAITGYLVSYYGLHVPEARSRLWLIAVLLLGGTPLILDLARKAMRAEFGSDLLAGISIVSSALLGEYLAGSIVVLMLAGGTALEDYATRRASAVLAALAKRMPRMAHRQQSEKVFDIDVSEVQLGDRLAVFPHEVCPADGVVVGGHGSMDESYLTGEPFLISKVSGSVVLSGAVNGESLLTISVSQLPGDSRYAKIMQVMQEAEAHRPKMRRIADRLGAWYTVLALAVASLGWAAGDSPRRFLAVLVIATPCPLLLAIPVAILGAISVAARRGIIVKDPSMLERLESCRTMILDKTGTLTYGKPTLSESFPAIGVEQARVMQLVASLEQYSKHPLATSVVEAAKRNGLDLTSADEISEMPGQGLRGVVGGKQIYVTGRKQVEAMGSSVASKLPPPSVGMECVVFVNGSYASTMRFRDTPRSESRSFITHLKPKHRFSRILLLSGDRDPEVRHLAAEVGITELLASQSPEQKLEVVKAETSRAQTLFVGDGINDAPAMEAATVGVAFGQNSDITAEAADAVVLEPSLTKVDELIHIGYRMRKIALQSAVGGMAASAIGMLLAATGQLPPVAGAVAQEVIDLAAVLNALRVSLISSEKLSDFG